MATLTTEYAIAKLKARMDVEEVLAERQDVLQCKPGNKPCGKICIPQIQKCKADGGGTAAKAIGTAVAVGIGGAILARNLRLKQKNQNPPANQKAIAGGVNGPRQIKIDSTLTTFLRTRNDSPKCEPGNKPCGKRCIPEKQNCATETAKGALAGARAGLLGLLAPVGTIANAAIGAHKAGGKGALKEVARGFATPIGGAVYGGMRARGHGRGRSVATAIGANIATGLGAYAAYSALQKKEDSSETREDSPKCEPGNKPCGKRCIPEKQNCATETAKGAVGGGLVGGWLGGPVGAVGGGVYGGMRARGHSQRKSAAFGAAAAIGTAAAFVGASVAGEASKQGAKQKDETDEAYKTLGVKKGASPDEIRAAYKAAARKYHPDINKDPGASGKFANINAAMDLLDPKRKANTSESQADNAERQKKGAKRARVRFNSLQARMDSFMFSKIQDAYKTIQENFSDVSPNFWYSR